MARWSETETWHSSPSYSRHVAFGRGLISTDAEARGKFPSKGRIEAARGITEQTCGFWTDQLNNTDQLAAHHRMADEIWLETSGEVTRPA
jgi:cysteine synthase